LEKTNDLIFELFQKKIKFFRPAFGVTNPRIAKAVKQLDLKTFGWSIRSLDTTKDTKEKVLSRITSKVKKGDVILLHDTSEKSVEVLDQLLKYLEKQQLKSVTLDQLFNEKAYV